MFLTPELRVGLCPDRLVVRHGPTPHEVGVLATSDPVSELRRLAAQPRFVRARLRVVLSNRFVRYAVLPWNGSLRTDAEWSSYAQLHFSRVYGNKAADWYVSLSQQRGRGPRVACAVDRSLREGLTELSRVARRQRRISAEPYFTRAFDLCRRSFAIATAWFVIQEAGALTYGLIEDEHWAFIRKRNYQGDWIHVLQTILDRENAQREGDVDRVLAWSEEDEPATAGRYTFCDVTPLSNAEPRRFAMAAG